MSDPIDLDQYVNQLEARLQEIPAFERHKFLAKIRDHVQLAARDSKQDLASILSQLGEPKKVAEDYLKLRKTNQNPSSAESPKLGAKNKTEIALLVALGLGLSLAIFFTLKKAAKTETFTDIKNQLISDSKSDSANLDSSKNEEDPVSSPGSKALATFGSGEYLIRGKNSGDAEALPIVEVSLEFENAKLSFDRADGPKFKWSCNDGGRLHFNIRQELLVFKTPNSDQVKCAFKVPAGMAITVKGTNGNVIVKMASAPVNVHLDVGDVAFESDPNLHYRFDNRVRSGVASHMNSENGPNSIPVVIRIGTGKILSRAY